MAEHSGYRTERLHSRRDQRWRRWQTYALCALAALVAFGAVVGASRLARLLVGHHPASSQHGYVALLTVGAAEPGRRPVAALVLADAGNKHLVVFSIPRSLLLTGPHGEYVFAGDMMGRSAFAAVVRRLIKVPIDFSVSLSSGGLRGLYGNQIVWERVDPPATVILNGKRQHLGGRIKVMPAVVPDLLAAAGASGPDEAAIELYTWEGILQTEGLASDAQRAAAAAKSATAAGGASLAQRRLLMNGLLNADVQVTQIPAWPQTSQGQFAYRPDHSRIMAQITRWAPTYSSRFTVEIRNGSGLLQIGERVAARLAQLDVNLVEGGNASSFNYKETQIIAGSSAATVAADIHAILGHGVILSGRDLPPNTVVVIVGKDIKPKDLQ